LVKSSASRRIAERWKVPLIEHPQAGHDLSLDDPQWIVDLLMEQKDK